VIIDVFNNLGHPCDPFATENIEAIFAQPFQKPALVGRRAIGKVIVEG
jgi:hypothetical protein